MEVIEEKFAKRQARHALEHFKVMAGELTLKEKEVNLTKHSLALQQLQFEKESQFRERETSINETMRVPELELEREKVSIQRQKSRVEQMRQNESV